MIVVTTHDSRLAFVTYLANHVIGPIQALPSTIFPDTLHYKVVQLFSLQAETAKHPLMATQLRSSLVRLRRNSIAMCLLGEEDLLAGPLEIGLNAPLHVREERLSSCPNACRLMYVSDIHLRGGRSGHLAMQVVDAVRRCDANVVLLGGDLVDNSSELGSLRAMVEQCRPIWFMHKS